MQGKSRLSVVVLSIVVLLLLTLSLTVQAQDGSAAGQSGAQVEALANGTTRVTASAGQQQAAVTFWTHEQLAAARPMEMPSAIAPRPPRTSGRQPVFSAGQTAAGGAAAAGADAAAQAAYPQDWAMLDSAAMADSPAAADGTSQIYTSYVVNKLAALWKTTGHKPTGRLSFSTPSGTSYCSASVVSGRNIIVTAAHCVYDTPSRNQFYSNWVFTPAYRNGAAPYGTFPAQTCWVLTSWVNLSGSYTINTWADDDVAVCQMGNNSNGQALSNVTGWYGRTWDAGYVQHVHNMGYPFNNYQNNSVTDAGKYLRLCANETFQQATDVLGGGCNWGPGISGGPWTISYDPFDPVTTYVASVNSGLFIGTQNLYGARFTSGNIVTLCNAAGC